MTDTTLFQCLEQRQEHAMLHKEGQSMLLLALLWLLGVIDITVTAILIHYNIITEWNPLLVWFLARGGLTAMVLFKFFELTCLIGVIALAIRRTWINGKLAKKYILAGTIIYAAIAIPAYIIPLFCT